MKKKLFKIFIIELVIVSMIFGAFYYFKNTSNVNIANILNSDIISKINIKDISVLNINTDLEDEIREGLLNGNEIIIIRDKAFLKTPDNIFSIMNNIVKDNAEIMYYSGVEYVNGRLKIKYTRPAEQLKNHQISLRNKRDEIVAETINESMTDYEKVKAIHDYIINNTYYDMDLFENGKVEEESYTAYGTLVLGVSVCEGYAKAMKYILDEVGIETLVIIGDSKNQKHAWNLVKLDGEYYHIDATWDDPITNNGLDVLQYNYFNLSDQMISKTHTWEKSDYPQATGEYYNYFNYNNLVVTNEKDLIQRIKNILINRGFETLFKYENYKEDNISINKIIEDIAYANSKVIGLQSYAYSIDENHGIFNITFNYH